jgi:DNA polymerase-4
MENFLMANNKRLILHIDFNSYFARVEQQKNPQLRGKPVGIIKAEGRGCVIAASVEAKQQGVRTGTTVREAIRLTPEIMLIPADFDSYYHTTKQFVSICQRYTDQLELFSLDEVFMDVTRYQSISGPPRQIALKIKRDLRAGLGDWLTVSVGIAKSKLLSKIASDMKKPDGLIEITDNNQDDYLGQVKFDQVCGIGPRLERRLRAIGISQLLQIRAVPDKYLLASFGPYWAKELKRISWGTDNSPVVPIEQFPLPKSVSRTYTLYRNINDQKQVLATIRNLVEEATEKLRQAEMAGRQFGLMVRGPSTGSGRGPSTGLRVNETQSDSIFVTRKRFTNDPLEIFGEIRQLFYKLKWTSYVRFLGVWISLLAEEQTLTNSLLPDVRRRQKILKTQDQINSKFGHYTLFPASLLRTQIVQPEVNGYLGDEPIKYRISQVRSPL